MEEKELNLRLQIKTLNQKTLIIEIIDSKTVFDLKKELSLYADVGVRPEEQRLIYAGRIMSNERLLSSYNIDIRKSLMVMKVRPEADAERESLKCSQSSTSKEKKTESTKTSSSAKETSKEKEVAKTKLLCETEPLVESIVAMGYDEKEVRKALAASFNNAERAIEYLIEGIPSSGNGVELSNELHRRNSRIARYRNDRHFRSLRNAIRDNPEDTDGTLEVLGYENPALLRIITDHQDEFLEFMLSEDISDDDYTQD